MHYFFNSSINCVQHNKKQTSLLVPVFKQTNKETYPSMGKQITFSLSEDSFFTLHVLSVSISCSPSLLENDTNAILVSFSSVVSMTTSVVHVGLRLLALPDTRTLKINTMYTYDKQRRALFYFRASATDAALL